MQAEGWTDERYRRAYHCSPPTWPSIPSLDNGSPDDWMIVQFTVFMQWLLDRLTPTRSLAFLVNTTAEDFRSFVETCQPAILTWVCASGPRIGLVELEEHEMCGWRCLLVVADRSGMTLGHVAKRTDLCAQLESKALHGCHKGIHVDEPRCDFGDV